MLPFKEFNCQLNESSEPEYPMAKKNYEKTFNKGKGVITHILPKNHVNTHKSFMKIYDHKATITKLPKDHPKSKTHVGLVSHTDNEDYYNHQSRHSESVI